jgi:HEPN domain-containing protein
MTRNDEPHNQASKWLREADRDLHAARLLLHTGEPEPSRSLFHSQQAVEKAAKAFLALRDTPFRKTHDLVLLGLQCVDLDPSLEPIFREAADLTDYASVFRYPDAPYEPDSEEASRALEVAARVYTEVLCRLKTGDD